MSRKTDHLHEQIVKARHRERMAILVIISGFLLILLGIYAGLIVKKGAGGPYHPYIDLSIFILVFGFLISAIGGVANTYYGRKRFEYSKFMRVPTHEE